MINDISAVRAGYAAMAQPIATAASLGDSAGLADDQIQDELDLSPLSLLSQSLHGIEPRADGNIHIEDIRAAAKQRLNAFKGRLEHLMDEAGIDRSEQIVLQQDEFGDVFVAGDHPDKEEIEELFDDNPELGDAFREIAGMMEFLNAADETSGFQEAYAKDPYEAVRLFSQVFDEQNDRFGLRIGLNNIESFFTAG